MPNLVKVRGRHDKGPDMISMENSPLIYDIARNALYFGSRTLIIEAFTR
jgi:hypothetical protein